MKNLNRDLNCNDVNSGGGEAFGKGRRTKRCFESRRDEVATIRSKFPTKVPLIVERYYKEKSLPLLDKTKFLVPQEITMSQFLVIVRNRMKILPTQAVYLLIDNRSMLSMSQTMAQAYQDHMSPDGFLYITYASQEMFGNELYEIPQ